MTKIRYMVLSDIHLGAYNSLLTYIEENQNHSPRYRVNAEKTSPVLKDLFPVLETIVQKINETSSPKVEFILLGDVFELALGSISDASMSFERFLECCFSKGTRFSDHMIYIPGNHDHHLWETAREKQYTDYIASLKPKEKIQDAWHTTKMISPDFVTSDLLTEIMRRNKGLKRGIVKIAYPNLEISNSKQTKTIFLTHGHFLENIYELMSSLQSIIFPEKQNKKTIYDLERENFAWIDFFWSTLGRSGSVGEGIGLIYDKLQSEKAIQKLATNVAGYLVGLLKIGPILRFFLKYGLGFFLGKWISKIGQSERGMSDGVLGEEITTNLDRYFQELLPGQWEMETDRKFPNEFEFIFGHTHKPFSSDAKDLGLKTENVSLFNTGGWVVDTVEPTPAHGGAVILIDDDANAVSFRIYKEQDQTPFFEVPSGKSNPLYESLSKKIDLDAAAFLKLKATIHSEIELRRKVIEARIKEQAPSEK